MTQLEKASLLLSFYKSNGFTWSSSVVLEPLGRVMYELGKADSRFEFCFKALEDLHESTLSQSSDRATLSNDLKEWLDLEISEFNPVLRMAIFTLWQGLHLIEKAQEHDYNKSLLNSLKRKNFGSIKLFLNSVARLSDLQELLDQEKWVDRKMTALEAERFCTRYTETFLNSFFKIITNLNKKKKQNVSRQQQCITLLELDSELSLRFLPNGISNSDYQKFFNCNRVAAKRDLRELIDIKMLRLKDEARGRSTRYVLF